MAANVTTFVLDGTSIDIEDKTARASADNALTASAKNTSDIATLKELSRLTVSYDQTASTITFSTKTH